jgi:hypothetical protein
MTNLSPAAQAVLDAAINVAESPDAEAIAAAALRAAADQVVPLTEVTPQENLESCREAMVWGMKNQTQLTRQHFLAIAAELEGGQ